MTYFTWQIDELDSFAIKPNMVNYILQTLNENKAPDENGSQAFLLNRISNDMVDPLSNKFNNSFKYWHYIQWFAIN